MSLVEIYHYGGWHDTSNGSNVRSLRRHRLGADTRHDVCVQAAGSSERRFECVPHQVACIEQWAESLRQ